MSMMPPREIQHRLEAYSPKCLERLSGKSRRAPNRGHRGQHRGARRPYFRVAGERSSLVDTSPTYFPDSLWKVNSPKFALTCFSEVVAPASQLCYLVCKRSGGEREEGGVKWWLMLAPSGRSST